MSTQPLSDLKSTTPAIVSRNAMNPFGAKDLTALAATLSPVAASARVALITTAPYCESEVRRGSRGIRPCCAIGDRTMPQ
jgi:hypothetical protein